MARPESSKGGSKKKGSKKKGSKKRRKNPPLAEVDEKDIEEALLRPDQFGLSSDHPHYREMFETWSLGPVVDQRDATMLAKANWAALQRELERHPEWEDQWSITGSSHWAVGWVDHLSFQVLDNGEPTEIFRFLKGWFDALSDYPVADEELYSSMQMEAYEEQLDRDLEHLAWGKLREDLPSDWKEQIHEKLQGVSWDYDPQDVPYHDEATLEGIADELGFLDDEMAEDPASDPLFLVFQERTSGCLIAAQLLSLIGCEDGSMQATVETDLLSTEEWTRDSAHS